VMVLKPGVVVTKMSKEIHFMPTGVSTQTCVNGTLRDLGYEQETMGPLRHELDNFMLTVMARSF